MSRSLQVLAGAEARRRIEEEGFSLDLFNTLIGASGGPKWLSLYGLDKVLAPALAKRDTPIDLVGSSIGALRLACYAQEDPAAAFDRFLAAYTDVHDFDLTPDSIERFMIRTAEAVGGSDHGKSILENPTRRLHIVTARCSGIADIKALPVGSMLLPGFANLLGEKWLARAGVERVMFASNLESPLAQNQTYPGHRVQLSEANLIDALLATGSIPGFSDSVRDIQGAPRGNYRDGGIVDYHFDPAWHAGPGLILYPHFHSTIVPRWFDKPIKSRHRHPSAWDRLVVLAPTDDYVARLPHGRIPDRRNGKGMTAQELHDYWIKTAEAGHELGEQLQEILERGETKHYEPTP